MRPKKKSCTAVGSETLNLRNLTLTVACRKCVCACIVTAVANTELYDDPQLVSGQGRSEKLHGRRDNVILLTVGIQIDICRCPKHP